MHIPRQFVQSDIAVMHALIRTYPLGTLITRASDGVSVNHLPMHLSADTRPFGLLSGHVPRVNPVWRQAADALDATVVFQGPQAYITPSWYASKKQHGKVVPTWNYTAVHAHGRLRLINDARWLRMHNDTVRLEIVMKSQTVPGATRRSTGTTPGSETTAAAGINPVRSGSRADGGRAPG
jgi:transcriptional regulator